MKILKALDHFNYQSPALGPSIFMSLEFSRFLLTTLSCYWEGKTCLNFKIRCYFLSTSSQWKAPRTIVGR